MDSISSELNFSEEINLKIYGFFHRYSIIFKKQIFLHFLSGRKLIFEKVILSNTAHKNYRRDTVMKEKSFKRVCPFNKDSLSRINITVAMD